MDKAVTATPDIECAGQPLRRLELRVLPKIAFVSTLIGLCAAVAGCKEEFRVKEKIAWKEGEVRADLVEVKPFQEKQVEKSLVYGRLSFDQKRAGTKVNLECIGLTVGDVESESIYVDSVAHIIASSYILETASAEVRVYWKMRKRIESAISATEPKIFLRKGCDLAAD